MPPSRSVEERLRPYGLEAEDAEAWLASGLPDAAFEAWVVDRMARRPAGARARAVYGAEDVHDFARRAILEVLAVGPGDELLDIGCGGGLLLRDAMRAGCRATGLDHSAAMVALARERAPGAIVVEGDAHRLPFTGATFTAVSMSVVFFFLDHPVAALRECRRVLRAGGRLAVFTTGPELRGTPAAPDIVAAAGHFYEDDALRAMAEEAGLLAAAVRHEAGAQLLTARR